MKNQIERILLVLCILTISTVQSQVTTSYDFESLLISTPINGQDNWFVHNSHSTLNNGNVCPPAPGTALEPSIFSTVTSGSYSGSQALRQVNWAFGNQNSKMSRINDLNWSFPTFAAAEGLVIEIDFSGNYWGKGFQLGYDNNGDNDLSSSCTAWDNNELSFGISTSMGNLRLHGANGAVIATGARPSEWARIRLCIDVLANGGSGSASLFYIDHPSSSSWIAHSISNINLGLNSAATDQTNPQNLNGLAIWQNAGGTGLFDNISVAVYYSNFTVCSTQLPVGLTAFNAERTDHRTALLTWTTESEINNDHFILSHSENLTDWTEIVKVNGQGSTSSTSNYSYATSINEGTNYFKLEQKDFDGTLEELGIRTVWSITEPPEEWSIFPNPSANVVNLEGKNILAKEINISDAQGKQCTFTYLSKSQDQITLDLSQLQNGIYILHIGQSSQLLSIIK